MGWAIASRADPRLLRGAPIRVRITVAFGVGMAIVLVAGSWMLYTREQSALTSSLDDTLHSRSDLTSAYVNQAGRGLDGVPPRLLDPEEEFAQVLTRAGHTLSTSPGFTRQPAVDAPTLAGVEDTTYVDRTVPGLGDSRVAVRPITRAGTRLYLVVGTSTGDVQEALDELLGILLVAVPVGLFATTAMGWGLGGLALRPVERMRRDADRISEGDLGRRLPVPSTGDELARLAATMNAMLDRVERAVSHERRLIDLASHELRTPLGVARAEVDLALTRPRTRDELDRALRVVADELDWMSRLSDDLLLLARTDEGRVPVRPTLTSLRDLAARCAGRFHDHARARGVDFRVDATDDLVLVDVDRMHQAISNMVDNALRHTASGGWVRIDARASDDAVRIAVEDSGEGFPDDVLDHVFEPFVTSKRDDSPGTGLGLTIVLAVARSHRGTAVAENAAGGGARVTLILPPGAAADTAPDTGRRR